MEKNVEFVCFHANVRQLFWSIQVATCVALRREFVDDPQLRRLSREEDEQEAVEDVRVSERGR